jgi:hypothetical protein
LRAGLDVHRHLDEPPETDLLGIPQLLEDDLIEGVECPLGVRLAHLGAVCDRGSGEDGIFLQAGGTPRAG